MRRLGFTIALAVAACSMAIIGVASSAFAAPVDFLAITSPPPTTVEFTALDVSAVSIEAETTIAHASLTLHEKLAPDRLSSLVAFAPSPVSIFARTYVIPKART